jgi:phage anti-repressor protein
MAMVKEIDTRESTGKTKVSGSSFIKSEKRFRMLISENQAKGNA